MEIGEELSRRCRGCNAQLEKGNEALNQIREERSQNSEAGGESSEGEM